MVQGRRRGRPGDRVFRVPRLKPWSILLPVVRKPKTGAVSPLIIVYGFLGVIAIGTLLLALPASSKSDEFTSFTNALFTATSAVCVTGHVVVDTGTYWSSFGQGVILALIQIGGFGFMTSATLLLLILGRKIGLRERMLIGESLSLQKLGGVVKLVKRIAIFTLIAEGIGALLFLTRFWGEGSAGTAIWRSVFHSISAFNNAGFDVFGDFRSLLGYQTDTLVVLVTAALIILGGISFIVVADVFSIRRLRRLSLDTKIVLTTTASLLIVGVVVFLVTEYSNSATLGGLSFPQKLSNAFFQSVTARTAGFSTIGMGSVADCTLFFTIILMFIGGAVGSTAGGIKVNNFGMLAATIWSTIMGREHAGAFGREFKTEQIHRALAIAVLSLGMVVIVVLVLTMIEDFAFLGLLFETVSAFGTVGLSTGITPGLSIAGRLIITATMFAGRLGPLALGLSLIQRQRPTTYRYPQDQVRIG
ncbi:MAG: Trk family potassium uptake protein [Chloroflexi bacterium]|nr:Trk family potassium uptake protein [Chloroflexota bacterium]